MTSASRKFPAHDTPVAPQLDDDALCAIRSLVAEQPGEGSSPASSGASQNLAKSHVDPSQKDAEVAAARPRKARNLPPLADPGADDLATKPRKAFAVRNSGAATGRRDGALGRLFDRMRASLASYRFRLWYAVLAGFALLIVFRPWLMLGVAFAGLFMGIGVYLILGSDGFWHGVIRVSRWYARRNPVRAKIIHQRLDGFAMRWDAVLDRFPEGTVDGLYLPDIGELATADARHDQAMERRLARLRENEA